MLIDPARSQTTTGDDPTAADADGLSCTRITFSVKIGASTIYRFAPVLYP